MPRPRKPPIAPHPDQDPFISDEDMPAGTLSDPDRTGGPKPPPVRYVYVLVSARPTGQSCSAAFRTPAAAQAALVLGSDPAGSAIETVRLYGSVEEWQAP